ncbi:hypothetical protein [Paenibacillus faecalis]|uniref:hypothetical protein n=1 Tax=Paenibacillus faecalis TaxID=2079532 RepID=UPI000D0F7165|nr:hypothetical protein [Paenibacillus faecalis]
MTIVNVTLDPSNKSPGIILSNDNLTLSSNRNSSYVIATHGKTKGKWYWEVKFDSGSAISIYIGVGNINFKISSSNWSAVQIRGAVPGDTIGLALNMDDYRLRYFKNGTELTDLERKIEHLGEGIFPFLNSASTAPKSATINFGSTPFKYPIPEGYLPYIDYHVRHALFTKNNQSFSITDPKPTDLVPKMTSNTLPSGIVKASSSASAGSEYRVFDKNKSGAVWVTSKSNRTGWIQYSFLNKTIVNRYGITPQLNAIDRAPRSWILSASNTGIFDGEEVVLDVRENYPDWNDETKYFDIPNNTDYLFYRLTITENNGSPDYTGLSELELFYRETKLVKLSSQTEEDFIKHGLDMPIDVCSFNGEVSINKNSNDLGSGKTFEHTIDLSKRKTNKISLNGS